MVEHRKTGRIHVGRFYWRRILRIWPLYFLIVVIALLLAPVGENLGFQVPSRVSLSVILSLVFLLPNMLRIIHPTLLGANQLWSVGIEEQFYAVWPLLIRQFIQKVIPFLISFIVLKLLLHVMLLLLLSAEAIPAIDKVERLYALFPVEQMAVGGLGAALLFYQYDHLIRRILKKWVFLVAIALLIISSVSGSHFILKTYLDAILFTLTLIHVVKRPELHQGLERSLFLHLGNISYGIYMWHTLVVVTILALVNYFDLPLALWGNVLVHVVSFILSVSVAHISYKWFETPFLKMKNRFAFDATSVKRKWASP